MRNSERERVGDEGKLQRKMRFILMVCHWRTCVDSLLLYASRDWGKTFSWWHESWMSVHRCVCVCCVPAPVGMQYFGKTCSFKSVSESVCYPHSKHHTHIPIHIAYMAPLPCSALLPPVPTSSLPLCFINHLSSPTAHSKAGPIRPSNWAN